MTYVQYINCDKWKKIIGVTLWIGATIGLFVGVYFGYVGITHPLKVVPIPLILNGTQTYEEFSKQLNDHNTSRDYNQTNTIMFSLSLVGSITNVVCISYLLNRHYQWIDIRCGVKPKTEKVE